MTNKLPDGINFERPRSGAPEFVKGRMGVNMKRLLAWLEINNLHDEWLNFDLLQSKDGTRLYFSLNDWKATATPPQTPSQTPQNDAQREYDALDEVVIEYPESTGPTAFDEPTN